MGREGLFEETTFELRHECWEKGSHGEFGGEHSRGRRQCRGHRRQAQVRATVGDDAEGEVGRDQIRQDPEVMVRRVAFILSVIGSQWEVLSK